MYLVTGAAGHLGQAVINHLLTTYKVPARDLVAASRNPEKLSKLKASGVQVRKADFDDEAGLAQAFAGVDRLLIISTDALDKPGRRLEQHRRAVAAAEKAGVGHVVYTSLPNAQSSAVLFAPDHFGTEQALAASALRGWTILRNNWYFENLFYTLPSAIAAGTLYTASGDGKLANIARDDLARAAAAALASNDTAKNTYTLSGAAARSTEELVALVAKAVAKPVNVVHVPLAGLIQGMTQHGVPEYLVKVFASFDEAIAKGQLGGDATDYQKLTGAEPTPFADWLKSNAPALLAASQKAA
jgi:NAD(P)H dehydrogenase (quinone)